MSFYVTLPSNACAKEFPTNTQTNYTTILAQPIQLYDDDYEVALTELKYTKELNKNNYVEIDNPFYSIVNTTMRKQTILFEVDMKLFNDLYDFFKNFNNLVQYYLIIEEYIYRVQVQNKTIDLTKTNYIEIMQNDKDDTYFIKVKHSKLVDAYIKNGCKYNEQTQLLVIEDPSIFYNEFDYHILRVPNESYEIFINKYYDDFMHQRVTIEPTKTFLNISSKLYTVHSQIPLIDVYLNKNNITLEIRKLMRFANKIIFRGNLAYIIASKEQFELYYDHSVTFKNIETNESYVAVYTNFIKDQKYGERCESILRIINIESFNNDIYNDPHYMPVSKSRIESINIKIKNLQGEFIQSLDLFKFVLVKLHFRKIQK